MSNNPEGLRDLAEWYRALANVGCTGDRAGRLKFADYLDRVADEIETDRRRAASGAQPCPPTPAAALPDADE